MKSQKVRVCASFALLLPAQAVTVFRFDSHFAAFRCTDLVIRVADVSLRWGDLGFGDFLGSLGRKSRHLEARDEAIRAGLLPSLTTEIMQFEREASLAFFSSF